MTLNVVAPSIFTSVRTSGAETTAAPVASVQDQLAGSLTFWRSPAPVQYAVMPVAIAAENAAGLAIVFVTEADVS